jgi:hypothetical protein
MTAPPVDLSLRRPGRDLWMARTRGHARRWTAPRLPRSGRSQERTYPACLDYLALQPTPSVNDVPVTVHAIV